MAQIYAQDSVIVSLQILFENKKPKQEILYFNNQSEVETYINDQIAKYVAEGFLKSFLKSSLDNTDTLIYEIETGPLFQLQQINLYIEGQYESWQPATNVKHLEQKPFRLATIEAAIDQLIKDAEKSGFPFAKARLDSVRFFNASVSAGILLNLGSAVVFDTISTPGYTGLKQNFLHRHLRIEKGGLYNEAAIQSIPYRISRLPFVQLKEAPQVFFEEDRALIELNLQSRRVNRADGLIGIMPGQGRDGKTLITGIVDLSLKNLFASAKQFDMQWQRTDISSQILHMGYVHPFLLGTPLEISAAFDLLRQDSTFLNTEFSAQIVMALGNYQRFGLSTQWNDSRTLDQEKAIIAGNEYQAANFKLQYYGLLHEYNKLDDMINPAKGFKTATSLMMGNKKISNAFDGDSLRLNTWQFKAKIDLEKYFKTGKRSQIALLSSAAWLQGGALFINDLFRLGGYNSIRGFNENHFFTRHFALIKAEFRISSTGGTQLFALYDQAILQQGLADNIDLDYPLGIGAGLRLPVKAGLFTLIYAMGNAADQKFGSGGARLHFGFTGLF